MRCKNKKPARIYIDVTNRCQLRCLHCYADSGEPQENELTLAEIRSLIDQAVEMGVRNIVFSGGEPLMRDDLPDILAYARLRERSVTVLSNGLLIDPAWAKLFAKLNIRVKLSLDGATPETHEFLRGKTTFAKLRQAIECLQSGGVENIVLHYTIHRRNSHEILMLPGLLFRWGVSNLVISTIKPAGRAKVNEMLLIPPMMAPYVYHKINTLYEILQYGQINIQNYTEHSWSGFGCPASCDKFGITATGNFTPCTFLGPAFEGNNIREYSLAELWEQHLTRDDLFAVNEQCAQCPALSTASGGCRARALYYHQNANAPDPYCCATREQTEFIQSYQVQLAESIVDAV